MRVYFIAANLWLLVAFVVFLGRHWERDEPTMYSFYGVGRLFEPAQYNYLVAAPLAMAAVCAALFVTTRAKNRTP